MYPEGMLDRDQRTAKITLRGERTSDRDVPITTFSFLNSKFNASLKFNSIISRIVTRRKYSNFSYLIWKKGYLIRFQRLKNVLLVLVYLTLLTTLPTLRAAPSRMEPKWANPCHPNQPKKSTNCSPDSTDFGRKINTSKLLKECLLQVNIAHRSARDYITNFTEFPNYNSLPKYEWLPEIGKNINEDIPTEMIKDKMVEEVLPEIYENLQKIAVGLEQVVKDHRNNIYNFTTQESQNLQVLCQLKETMDTMKICFRPDVSSDIMSERYRNGDETEKMAKAMVIFREYINNLEYAEMVLNHLNQKGTTQEV